MVNSSNNKKYSNMITKLDVIRKRLDDAKIGVTEAYSELRKSYTSTLANKKSTELREISQDIKDLIRLVDDMMLEADYKKKEMKV